MLVVEVVVLTNVNESLGGGGTSNVYNGGAPQVLLTQVLVEVVVDLIIMVHLVVHQGRGTWWFWNCSYVSGNSGFTVSSSTDIVSDTFTH